MAMAKDPGQRAWVDPDDVAIRRVAREIASKLSPETTERLASLSLRKRAELVRAIEALIDRLDRSRGAA